MNQVAAGHRVQVQIPEMHLAGKKATGTWTKKLSDESNLPMSNASEGEVFHPDLSIFSFISTSFTHQESCKGQKGFGCCSWGPSKVVVTNSPLFFRSLWENLKVWSQRHQAIGHHPVLPKLLAQFETIQQGPGVHQVAKSPASHWVSETHFLLDDFISIFLWSQFFESFPFEGKCFYKRQGWNEWTPLQLTIVLALISIAVLIISLFFSDSSAFSSGLNSFTSSWCQESRVRHFFIWKDKYPWKEKRKGCQTEICIDTSECLSL